jgi:pilus assembly protein Flp/PilA
LTVSAFEGGWRYLFASAAREVRTLSIQNGFVGQNNEMGPGVKIISRFLKDETAATAIEYGLIAAGIAIAIIAAVNGLGSKLNTKFTSINSSLK